MNHTDQFIYKSISNDVQIDADMDAETDIYINQRDQSMYLSITDINL